MEDKYYTPEIEEFHIGFEYEFKTSGVDWKKFIFDLDRPDKVLENFKLNPQLFRVKYLDKEDIESLNITILDSYDDYLDCHIGVVKIDNETYSARLEYFANKKLIEIYLDYTGSRNIPQIQTLFKGTINNKSELKVLIKQLQIIK